jgi:hypothetical protein
MSYLLPISSDPLNSPDHSLLHRIITVDSAAAEQSLKIDSSSNAILLGGVQVETSFTGKQISTPSNPASGYNKAYFKTDNRLYLLTSGGTESLVGNISGSTGATTGAILIANGTGGSTLQATGITIDSNDNIVLPTTSTTGATTGVIYKGSVRWLHNYQPQYAGGNNVFIGLGAGNFTMTSGSGTTYQASNLIGIGGGTLSSITTGYQFVAIGTSSYAAVTTGSAGTAVGHFTFQRNTSQAGTAFGQAAGRYVIGYANSLFGISAGQGVDGSTTYGYTTALGAIAASVITTSSASIYIGAYAGGNVTTGNYNVIISSASTAANAASLISGSSNIFIGNNGYVAVTGTSSSSSNELNIGNALYATGLYGTPSFGIGVDSASITARLHLPAGNTTASRAPLKFTSGSLLSSAEAGAMEFLTDAYYLTITTGAVRQQIVTDTNTVTMTNKTLTAPKIASGGFIADASGNEQIIFTTTASAVNEITFANAATGNNPKFSATGGDSNIGIDFQVKGTGTYRLLGTSSQAAELRLYEDTDAGTNYTAFKVGTQSGDITYTLPTTAPTVDGQVLSGTTGGVMSWTTVGSTPKMKISTAFETAARFTLAASGGVGTFSNLGYDIDTTSTATRYASAKLRAPDANFSAFADSPTFSASFILATKGTTASAYIGIGTVTVSGTGHTFTNNHIGFKVIITGSTATLYATQGDGSTENASSALTTLASNDSIDVICVVNGTASVDYYWRKNGGSLSSATNLTSNLPTATTETMGQFSLANDSTASQTTMYFNSASYER